MTGFLASTGSAYDFYTLYTTLFHTLIKEQTELIELTCKSEGLLYLDFNEKTRLLTFEQLITYALWS